MKRLTALLCGWILLLSLTGCDGDTAYEAGMTALQNQNYAKAYELFLASEDPRAEAILKDFVFVPVEKTFVSSTKEKESVTTYTYDDKGQLIKYQTDVQGIEPACEYAYDNCGRLLRVTEASGSMEQYSYDANGYRISKVRYKADEEIYREEYFYDEAYNMVEQTTSGATGEVHCRREYDAERRCTKVWQGNDTSWYEVTMEYDAAGNAVKSTSRYSDGSWSESTAQYDDQGNKSHAWYKDKSGADIEILYEYDENGNCVKERYPHSQVAEYAYDAAGNLVSEITATGNRTTYAYDEQGRLLLQVNTPVGEGGIETRLVYTYDEAGHLLSQTTVTGDDTTVLSYTYDQYGNPLTYRQTYNGMVWGYEYRWTVYYYPAGLSEVIEELLEESQVVDPLEKLTKPPSGLN